MKPLRSHGATRERPRRGYESTFRCIRTTHSCYGARSMTKQDRANLQAAINAAQEAIDKAVLDARDIIEDEDDEDVVEAMEGLLDELDTQLPAVADYFPDDAKP